jgi:hypothetical protein
LVSSSHCQGLSYDQDIDPWLGDRAAVALVPLPDASPDPVVVVQVTDEGKARAGIAKITACSDTGDDGVVVANGWAVLAESQKVADEVSAATETASLADDATFQRWTKAVGEAGVVNAYASPDAGRVLSQELGGFFGVTTSTFESSEGDVATAAASASAEGSGSGSAAGESDDPFSETLAGFKGGAATLRFTGDGLELAMAGDGTSPQVSQLTGTTGGELVRRLPDDTAVAAGVTLNKGWLENKLSAASLLFGGGVTGPDARREIERETGLSVPEDIETLLGSGVAVSVSKDIDLEAALNSDDGTGIPVAATVKGDPDAIAGVLDKLRAKTGNPAFLGSDASDGLVAIGPSEDYRKQVLAGGDLGGNDAFTSVVPDAEHASGVVYVNVDALEPALRRRSSGEDSQDLANLTPLRALGLSTWTDGGVIRFSLKVTTN